jgi:hypothetical protein
MTFLRQTTCATSFLLVAASVNCGGGTGAAGAGGGSSSSGGASSSSASSGGGAGGFVPTGLVVDFRSTSAAFPPTVNKVGYNSFWNSTSNDADLDAETITRSAAFRAPMISGLIEPKVLSSYQGYVDHYEEYSGSYTAADLDAEASTLWKQGTGFSSPLFVKSASLVASSPTDPDLSAIRAKANAAGLINFLQISGTPGSAFPSTSTLDNGFFLLGGTPTTGGNWYPLPANANKDFPVLAKAFGTLPNALGDDTRTIFAFWQEPSHTIDESISADVSIDRYARLYWQVAHEITTQCLLGRCPMAGAQLNANDGDSVPHDGYRYQLFMAALRTHRLANPGVTIPLDYFTVQSYAAQWNDNVVANTRVALGTDSSWTPVLVNEWDYCVNTRPDDGCTPDTAGFEQRYDGETSWKALHWLEDTLDRPDISHVLLREKVLKSPGKGKSYFFPWAQVPILFRGAMSELRRPVSAVIPELPIVASGDEEQLTILAWNEGTSAKTLPLSFVGLPASLLGTALHVKRMSKAIRDAKCPGAADVMSSTFTITCWEDAIPEVTISAADLNLPAITVAPGEATMIFAGSPPPYGSTLFKDHFVRSYQHVGRDGTEAAPKDTAHFDPRTGTITVGVQKGGAGVGRMLLTSAPSTLTVATRVAAQGGLSADTAVAGVRVDYIGVGANVAKTVFFRDSRWTQAAVSWSSVDWTPAAMLTTEVTDLCGTGCATGSGSEMKIDIAGHAPPGWLSSDDKEIDVGVILAGSNGDAIYRVQLR